MQRGERGTVPHGPTRRGDAMATSSRSRGGGNAAYQRLAKSIDSASDAAKSLSGNLSKDGRALLKNVENQLKDARKDLDKNGRKLLDEIEQRLAQARGSGRSTAKRSTSRATTKRSTARRSTAKKS